MVMLTFESVDKIPKSMIVVLDLTKLYLLAYFQPRKCYCERSSTLAHGKL